MLIDLEYGREGLAIELPDDLSVDVIEPTLNPGLDDERASFIAALREPVGAPPLREVVRGADTVGIVFSDITRPAPSERMIPWLLEEIEDLIAPERITLFNALGLHRQNTREELGRIITPEAAQHYRVVNPDPWDESTLAELGRYEDGLRILVNREYLECSRRILTGFIEPHFFAGFSGGGKSVLPGLAGEETVLHNHNAAMIGHPQAAWGVTAGNPIFEDCRRVGLLTKPHFIANTSINRSRRITGVFAGDLTAAHDRGCEFVRRSAMQPVAEAYDVVVTTNGGYPLDLNLYQTVKGMSAAAQIVKPGGAIVCAAECCEGLPDHGNFRDMLARRGSPAELLEMIEAPGFLEFDQWEVQVLAMLLTKADIYLCSSLTDEETRGAHLAPCRDVAAQVVELAGRIGPEARVAVLPQGPQTIPYLT